jgi:transcription initiation factor IIF auxiliary subunit
MDIYFDPNNGKKNIGLYHVFMKEPYKSYVRQKNMFLHELAERKSKAALNEAIPAAIDNAIRQAAKDNPNITVTG